VGKFATFIDCPKIKSASALGGYAPCLLTRGSPPGTRSVLCPQTPVIGSRYCAHHGAVSPPLRWCGLEPPLYVLRKIAMQWDDCNSFYTIEHPLQCSTSEISWSGCTEGHFLMMQSRNIIAFVKDVNFYNRRNVVFTLA